jgi:hypothetical protein
MSELDHEAEAMKFYQTLKQAPRSAKQNGKHRRAGAPAYGRPVVGTDYSAGGSDEDATDAIAYTNVSWTRSFTISPSDFAFPVARRKPEPPAIPYAGIRTGELIGHRLWWVIGGQLCSLAHRMFWLPGETINGDTNQIVDQDWFFSRWTIWGGTYAFSAIKDLDEEIANLTEMKRRWEFLGLGRGYATLDWMPLTETETFVAGTIKLWGDVVEHERGYRAEFAKINSLDAIYGPGDLAELRTKYGVASSKLTKG